MSRVALVTGGTRGIGAAISRRRAIRSAKRPAGMANSTNGKVSAVWSRPVSPSPAPSTSTATIGAAASATCSADWATRFDHARRLKVFGSEVS